MKSTMTTMVLSLTLIAAAMGGVLAAVHELTAEPIMQSAIKAKQDALAAILPAFDNDPTAETDTVTLDGESRPVTLYKASLNGIPVGTAVESWTMDGFSGEIIVMVGFDSEGKLTGYEVLQHAETPGLGAKANDWFRDPTGSRSVIGSDQPLAVTKDGGSIDGITAATITSRAFLGAVNRARASIEAMSKEEKPQITQI